MPTVQWFKNEINIDDSPDHAITYNNGEAVLKFLEIIPDDKAIYTCKATNKLGQASTSANLEVEGTRNTYEKSEKTCALFFFYAYMTIFKLVPVDIKPVEVVQTNGISSITPEPHENSKEISESKICFIKEQKIIQESTIVKVRIFCLYLACSSKSSRLFLATTGIESGG